MSKKKKDKIDHNKVLEIYKNLTPEEFVQLLWLNSERINIPVFDKDKKVTSLNSFK